MFVVATVFILMYLMYKNSLCKGILVMSSRCFSSARIRQLSALPNLQIFFTRSVWLLASALPFRLQFRAVFSSLSYPSYMYGLSNPSHIRHLALRFSLISEFIPKTYRYLVLRLSLNHMKNHSHWVQCKEKDLL